MTIKNLNGIIQPLCACNCWLAHWKKHSGFEQEICSATGCNASENFGIHVQKNIVYDYKWYIIPLCAKHKDNSGIQRVKEETTFVRAKEFDGCHK